jgi:hypothetical protein
MSRKIWEGVTSFLTLALLAVVFLASILIVPTVAWFFLTGR